MERITRLCLERLEDRCVPAFTMTWRDYSGDHNWANGANWQGGDGVNGPTADDTVAFGAWSVDYCSCALSGTVATGITITSGYTGTGGAGRLHFTASSLSIVTIGGSGITMHGGGIEQDNGCEIDVSGTSTWDGGDMNSEGSSALGTVRVQTAGSTFGFVGKGTMPSGEDIIIGTGASLTVNVTSDSGVYRVKFSKNGGIFVNTGGTLDWKLGGLEQAGGSTGLFTNQGTVDLPARTGNTGENVQLTFLQSQARVPNSPVEHCLSRAMAPSTTVGRISP
jgi:hypothetical protein